MRGARGSFARGLAVLLALALPAGARPPAPGAELGDLATRRALYRDARVVSVGPDSLTVRHAGGLAQIPWTELPPALQEQFGFDPAAAAAHAAKVRAEAERAAQRAAAELARRTAAPALALRQRVERVLADFGTPPGAGDIDLRPRFRELELFVRDQGRHPSCAVFAVVGALELQHAEITGRPEKLSEDYLVWATRRLVGPRRPVALDEGGEGATDAGFALIEVLQALRAWGVPRHELMAGRSLSTEPPADVVAEAAARREVFTHVVTGRTAGEAVDNCLHVLAAGIPVVVGVRWPHERAVRGGLLATQPPIEGYAHAVTLVGYVQDPSEGGEPRFIFRNSWGPRWGAGGYGYMTRSYLERHLLGAVFLEVRNPAAAPAR